MSPEQADRRILKSRQTLHALSGALGAGDIPLAALAGYRTQITGEITVLERIAAEHPSKSGKLASLVERYRVLSMRMGQQLH